MARIRSIRPELFEAKAFLLMPCELRFFLVNLVSLADDEGLLRAEPHYLKALRYIADDGVTWGVLVSWVDELERRGWIRTYEAHGDRYAVIVGWADKRHLLYQVINQPSPSRLPEPPPQPENPSCGTDYGSPTVALPHGSGSGSGSGREGIGSGSDAHEAPPVAARPRTLATVEQSVAAAKEAAKRHEKRLARPAAKRASVYREGYVARIRPEAMGAAVHELFPAEPDG